MALKIAKAVNRAPAEKKMTTRVASGREDQYLSERQVLGVRDRYQRGMAADRRESPRGAAMQRELRRAAASNDLDVAPQHALRMAGTERLHRGLLRREAAREMNGRVPPARAVGDLAFSEDSL